MKIRRRPIRIQVWVDEKELAVLTGNAKRSGLSRESYIRSLLNGYVPKEKPGTDFFALTRELHAIGNRMNQIAVKANALGLIDAAGYTENAAELRELTQKIYEAVMLPERMVKNEM